MECSACMNFSCAERQGGKAPFRRIGSNQMKRWAWVWGVMMLAGCSSTDSGLTEKKDVGVSAVDLHRYVCDLWSDRQDYVSELQRPPHKTVKRLQPISTPSPVYPYILFQRGAESVVWLSFVVDKQGNVENVRTLASLDERFDGAAQKAVMKWKFHPAESMEGPVRTFATVQMVFDREKSMRGEGPTLKIYNASSRVGG